MYYYSFITSNLKAISGYMTWLYSLHKLVSLSEFQESQKLWFSSRFLSPMMWPQISSSIHTKTYTQGCEYKIKKTQIQGCFALMQFKFYLQWISCFEFYPFSFVDLICSQCILFTKLSTVRSIVSNRITMELPFSSSVHWIDSFSNSFITFFQKRKRTKKEKEHHNTYRA